ncbi:NAD(P)/FAD-dependent oxidoreductase [Streptomyces cyanogenus]|uniref:FAD-dependent oxidoreductase LodB n=1 Tax=Streptomyces cyanogenus TaxID=80860 RepID=A0ABX7U512_STRCY|nr:NAD(P)/FAD-dependent oxidoreductase [Streptomyces cyanogenus]QTE03039.1 Putative FAD-dependent oxidoreductase LodB [Streptomyces cyanogenus]
METYDVVVVGARSAGAATAMLFARAGYRVLLLDRATFPSDTLSTQHIHRPGLRLLRRWGLLERLTATGCPPVRRISYTLQDVRLSGPVPAEEGIDAAYAPRRYVLDSLLIDAAVEAGAAFRQGCAVTGVLTEDGRVTGVRCRTGRAGPAEVRARLVVGADGMRSTLAGLCGAPVEREDAPRTCVYYGYWEGLPAQFEVYERTGRLIGVVGTHDELTLVAAYFPQEEFAHVRRDAGRAYLDAIRTTAPELAERALSARRVERLRGTGSQLNHVRTVTGPGWVLVGDAGCHKDSITGTGISDAFEQAALLAESVGDGLHDDRELGVALDRYATEHRLLMDPRYRTALDMARLEVPEERLEFTRWIARDPASAGAFLSVAVSHADARMLPAVG